MNARPIFRLTCLLAWGAGVVPAEDLPQPTFGPEILTRLRDPAQRTAAIAEIEEKTSPEKWTSAKRQAAPFGIRDPRLTPCPAREGPPLFLISYRTDYEAENQAQLFFGKKPPPPEPEDYPPLPLLPGAEKSVPKPPVPGSDGETEGLWTPPATPMKDRVLIFLNSQGKVIWPTGGDNFLTFGWIADFNKDGILDRADFTNWGNPDPSSNGTNIQSLQITTLELRSRTLLEVIYNWQDGGGQWGFEMADGDGDGTWEACLGPAAGKDRLASRDVVYRWNPGKAEWTGPDGGFWDHFRRFRGKEDDFSDWLLALSKEGGVRHLSPEEPEPELPPSLPATPPPPELSADAQLLWFYLGSMTGDSTSGEGFHLPPALWSLPAREAARALADGNRTPSHRQQFALLTKPAAGNPPSNGQVQLFQKNYWGDSLCTLLEITPAGASWSALDEAGHAFTAGLPLEDGRWLFQVIWWLEQIRTRALDPVAVVPDNEWLGGSDIPDFTLTLTPDEKERGVSLPRSILQPVGTGWRGHYDRNITHRLAVQLCVDWNRRHDFPTRPGEPGFAIKPAFLVEQLRKLKLGTRDFPDLWAEVLVKAATQTAIPEALPELQRLSENKLLAKAIRESQTRGTGRRGMEKSGQERYEATIKALIATGQPVPLDGGAAEKNAPILIREGHAAEVIAWFRALPPDRSEKIVWLLGLLPEDLRRDPSWGADLIRTLTLPRQGEAPDWLAQAVEYLVPPERPFLHRGPEIDQLLSNLSKPAAKPSEGVGTPPEPDGLEAAIAAALARRAVDASRLEIIGRSTAAYDYFAGGEKQGYLNDSEAALAHLAVKFPGPATAKLTEVIQARLLKTKGRDAAPALLAWTADLRSLESALEEKSTSGPMDAESEYMDGWGGDHEEPSRTHAARRALGIWREKDPLTKAKAIICLAALPEFRWESPGLYGPASRLRDHLDAALAALPAPGRKALAEFAAGLTGLDAGISLGRSADLKAAALWAQERLAAVR